MTCIVRFPPNFSTSVYYETIVINFINIHKNFDSLWISLQYQTIHIEFN